MEKTPGMLDSGVGVLGPDAASGAGITLDDAGALLHASPAAVPGGVEYKQHIYILRHGERRDNVDAEWLANAFRKWDPPLTEEGKKQAWAAGRKLRESGAEVNRVLVSPYLRCVQTAAEAVMALCVGQQDLSTENRTVVLIDPSKLKVSIEYGLGEVMNQVAIRNPPPSADIPWTLDLSELRSMLPQGTVDIENQSIWPKLPDWPENLPDSHTRFAKVLRATADKFPAENILCVTHGEAVAVSVSHLQPSVLVYGVEYCGCSHWQRSVKEIDGKLVAGEFELLTEPMKTGVLFGDPTEITAKP